MMLIGRLYDESDDENDETVKGPMMKPIPPDIREEGMNDVDIEDVDEGEEDHAEELEPDVPVESDLQANEARTNKAVPVPQDDWVRRSARLARQIGLVVQTGTVKRSPTECRLPIMVETLSKRLSQCTSRTPTLRGE